MAGTPSKNGLDLLINLPLILRLTGIYRHVMMLLMDNNPLQEFPPENEGAPGEQPKEQPNLITKWMESLAHLGLGEFAIRIGTNVVTILMVILVVWLMQTLYKQSVFTPNVLAAGETAPTPTPGLDPAQWPTEAALALDGVSRQAVLHTTIPTRPREDVTKYTVQTGDSVFVIADKFGLKPSTILFGNFSTLSNNVDLIKPGQVLNILPVDGTYYQWQGNETLTGVAKFYKADPQAIIESPANHLDPDTIGDLSPSEYPQRYLAGRPGRLLSVRLERTDRLAHIWSGHDACYRARSMWTDLGWAGGLWHIHLPHGRTLAFRHRLPSGRWPLWGRLCRCVKAMPSMPPMRVWLSIPAGIPGAMETWSSLTMAMAGSRFTPTW